MGDPERIARLTSKLMAAWQCVPDWRLGQLISNLQGTGPQDVFHVSDDKWERMLDDFIAEVSP